MSRSGTLKSLVSRVLIILLLAVALSGVLTVIAAQTASAAVPINRSRITYLIYPTIGYPAIVKCGDMFTIEFDPRAQNWSQGLPSMGNFQVSATTTNSASPVTKTLPVDNVQIDYSTHWPEYSASRQPNAKIYQVTVQIPESVPVHLYDLTVSAKNQQTGQVLTDAQPHALQTVAQYKTDVKFAQLTDIHVWGPELSYPTCEKHERNYRHANYSETDGYGAAYYHKTIQQMNIQKPDFIVYTGDYDYSQQWLYQQDYSDFSAYKNSPWNGKYYEPWFEMDWFYQETLALNVPVFMVPGNHDTYARYNWDNSKLEEDYLSSWRKLFGPTYSSFQYGPDDGSGYHFTGVCTDDWSSTDRNLHWLIPNKLLRPGKWQGQVQSGGDAFEAGWTQARENAVDESKFGGELLWAKQDLQANSGDAMRVLLLHHDPWKSGGSGVMFDNVYGTGGEGAGRLALIKLARENHVSMVLSGHDHFDDWGSLPWEGGGPAGTTEFVNTTSVQFQDSSDTANGWRYPGYKMLHVNGGIVVNDYYKPAAEEEGGAVTRVSWPSYAGTVVGGQSNFSAMVNPAVQQVWTTGTDTASCQISNNLCGQVTSDGSWSGDIKGAGMEFAMPYLTGGYYYTVTNGAFSEIYDNSTTGPTSRICEVATDVDHGPAENSPTNKTVTVAKSATPDVTPPACTTFQINGGAPTTDVADVTLTNDASDAESGMMDMMISNDDPTFTGCQWQRYEASTGWRINEMAGLRTVYIKFRDAAMPSNVSAPMSASISMIGDPPTILDISPEPAHVGDTVTITGTDFGTPATPVDNVTFCGLQADVTSWNNTAIQCVIPEGAYTGTVAVETDAGTATIAYQVLPEVLSLTPGFGYNNAPVQIVDLEGSGFYVIPGGHPIVTISKGPNTILATNVVLNSAQSLSCKFDITDAEVGDWDVFVQNVDGGGDILPSGFYIDYPAPAPTAISPTGGDNTGKVNATITGNWFRAGCDVWMASGGTEIAGQSIVYVSPTKVTCSFDLTGAAGGKYDVCVENDDLEYGTITGGFTVNTPPVVTGVSPSTGKPGDTVTITGTAFGGSQGTSTLIIGNVPATPTSWTDTKITATVPPGASTGAVVVNTPQGESNPKAFTVVNPVWYLAEGTTAWGFGTYITIENPNAQAVSAKITYMIPAAAGTAGKAKLGATRTITLPAQSQTTVNPAQDLSGPTDFSTKVECLNGKTIAVDRTMTWTGPGAPSPEGHCSIGATGPTTAWYLPDGSSNWGFETWTMVQNPGNTAAKVTLTYMIDGVGPRAVNKTVAANSRATFGMAADVGAVDASVKVASDQPVIAEGSMYRNNRREGTCSIGATGPATDYFLSEGTTAYGFTSYVLVQNPNSSSVDVTLTYMTPQGPKKQPAFAMTAGSRETIRVNDVLPGTDFSTQVAGNKPIIAARSMLWGAGTPLGEAAHSTVGLSSPHMAFYLPDGQTSGGYQTYTCVQNPNPGAVTVKVTYMTPTGTGNVTFNDEIAANSRKTYTMADKLASGRAAVMVQSLDGARPIMVERPMYWNSRGAGTDTIGGFTD
jgi:hypothetical protein